MNNENGNNNSGNSSGSNTLLKVLGIIACLFPMVGFGLCGVFGVGMGVASYASNGFVLLLGLGGLALSAFFARAIWQIIKSMKSAR